MAKRNRHSKGKPRSGAPFPRQTKKKSNKAFSPKPNSPFQQLEEVSGRYREIRNGHREAVYHLGGEAAALSAAIELDDEQRKEFWAHAYWKNRKRPKDFMTAVMHFMHRAKTVSSSKRAYKHARGIGYVVITLNTDPDDVVEKLKELGGLQKACDLAAAHDPRKTKTKTKTEVAAFSDESGSSNEIDDDDLDDEASIPPFLRRKPENKVNTKTATFRDDWDEDELKLPKVYSITAKLSRRRHQETEEMEIGEGRVLTIRRVDGDPNFRVTRVEKLRTKKGG
ncbi:hypothetical protein V5F77_25450 [Xanthobacter sp. DSM 24535]|uniref:hypothetical protein n=1 Tax=Roseixanthobacter psychrophilus TaxID=3119917 RepID=UPI00372CDFF8